MISEFGKRVRSALRFFRMDSVESRNIYRFAQQYLRPMGWLASARDQVSVSPDGDPCPWFSYPSLRMVPRIARPTARVMEFGGGQSTHWWAKRVTEVVSVEHDAEWHKRVTSQSDIPMLLREANTSLEDELDDRLKGFYELGLHERGCGDLEEDMRAAVSTRPFHAYAAEMMRHPKGYFDIAVVDGMARVLCTWVAIQCLDENGIVILDNADNPIFEDAVRMLEDAGYVGIEFWGPAAVVRYESCTTFFVRNLDVLRKD